MNSKLLTTAIVLSFLSLAGASEETSCVDDPTFLRNEKNCAAYLETKSEKRCAYKENGVPISEICRVSCGTCNSPGRSGSGSCFDDPTFRWKGEDDKNCISYTGKNTQKKCDNRQDGIFVRESCPVACGVCTGPCFDDPTFRKNGDKKQNCATYLKKDKEKLCDLEEKGVKVRDLCRASCGTCTACDDDPTFRWEGNESLTCEIFTETDMKKKCDKKQDGIKVRDSCRASCGTCSASLTSFAPSTRPSAVPSMLPSASFYPSRATSEARFADISEKLATYASDELAHPFVQKPWVHFHGPMTFDINGDGFADMLSHHHVGDFSGNVGAFWDLALSSETSNNEITYKAGKVDIAYKARIPDASVVGLEDVKSDIKLRCMQKKNMVDGSIVDEFNCLDYPDFHGTAVLDLDRDGKLDMFVGIGGGGGYGNGVGIESMLFWGVGEDKTNPNETSPNSDLSFAGGRGALVDAGLSSGRPQRTYGLYFADLDGNGYLDVFPINKYRKESNNPNDDAPGNIFMNRGELDPRQFDIHLEVSEFASTAILTDFDQDGFAQELLVFERTCLKDEPNCVSRPRGSVYKWDATVNAFEQIWRSSSFSKGTNLVSTASGDFNGDGLTDIVILTERNGKGKLQFWYSSSEDEPLGSSKLTIQFPENCSPRHSIRVADFDLNGTLDLFVLCEQGTHVIFQKSSSDLTWSAWDVKTLGPLGDPERNTASTQAYFDRCFGDGLEQCESDAEELETIESKIGKKKVEQNAAPVAQGVTVFDHNNDGFVDIFLSNRGGVNTLFENKGIPGNKYISFILKGTTSNVDGIGAILLLTWNNGVGTEEKLQLWEHNAQSFETDGFGSRDSRIVFGLGKTGVPLKLEVRWPSGIVSTLTEEMLKDVPMTMNYNEIKIITEPE